RCTMHLIYSQVGSEKSSDRNIPSTPMTLLRDTWAATGTSKETSQPGRWLGCKSFWLMAGSGDHFRSAAWRSTGVWTHGFASHPYGWFTVVVEPEPAIGLFTSLHPVCFSQLDLTARGRNEYV